MEKKLQKKCDTNLYVDLNFQIRPKKGTPKGMKQANSNSHQKDTHMAPTYAYLKAKKQESTSYIVSLHHTCGR